MICADNIPWEIKPLKQWVLWKSVDKGGKKPSKVPFRLDGGHASVSEPSHWATFDEILKANPQGYDGVGFVFTRDDAFVGIDLDDCRDPETGEIENWAQDIIWNFGSYAEISPSRTGVKIWATGELPIPIEQSGKKFPYKTGSIEMYHHSRYFTVTGDII